MDKIFFAFYALTNVISLSSQHDIGLIFRIRQVYIMYWRDWEGNTVTDIALVLPTIDACVHKILQGYMHVCFTEDYFTHRPL